MVKEFLRYLQYEKNYSSHTVLSYYTDIKQFCNHLNIPLDNIDVNSITPYQIQEWIFSLINENKTTKTLSRKISTLKSFWKFLLIRNYAEKNPVLKITIPKTKKSIPAFFKENEMTAALLNEFTPNDFVAIRNQLIISLFYQTGIRLSELISIKDSDIDLASENLSVIGKRNKQRIIPICKNLIEEINNYIAQRDKSTDKASTHLFLLVNGKKMYPKLIYNIVHSKMSEVSNLHKRSPHILRHTFATSILNGGAEINAVKELLGHSSLAATQIYTHTSFKELNNIYKQAHPRAH